MHIKRDRYLNQLISRKENVLSKLLPELEDAERVICFSIFFMII